MNHYLVAANRPWHRELFIERTRLLPGEWKFVSSKEELTDEIIQSFRPRYIFFPHWSHIVPERIWKSAECVCFHMTDLPYGRGGSPLQNLIVRKHERTKLSAFRMVQELDAGPIYGKQDLSMGGSAQDIYRRAGVLTWDMIETIVRTNPEPVPQQGQITVFPRRTPQDGNLTQAQDLAETYDYIRMLDAEGYPPAFLEIGSLIYEFTEAKRVGDRIVAHVSIRNMEKSESK